ncbi:Solute carrier organic anion transporter family member 1A1 [Acipenser ruthenus]|uniref:Solute carrier organic anion transporter family member 1A1 n=1 Tax=Acipenser ruthenus TaxID=7906 RepID=A0A444V665_ACIRT|nr:Solute carrier organic anion transporter family member 1A1 [Acipenser ruthenus]
MSACDQQAPEIGTMRAAEKKLTGYEHETSIAHSVNLTTDILPCQSNQAITSDETANSEEISVAACIQTVGILGPVFGYMMGSLCAKLYVDIGFVNLINAFIGIITFKPKFIEQTYGQSPSKAIFLIACLQTVSLLGPMFGFLLGSLCAKLYVDIGFVDLVIMLFASFPFWFLPKSLPKQGEEKMESGATAEQSECVKKGCREATNARPLPLKLADIAKGGIPAPVYFGALIDSTCLKWGSKKCGGRGACRMYNSDAYRLIYLGLISALSGSSYFFMIAVILLLRKQFKRVEKKTQDDADGHTEIEFTHVDEAELNHDMKLVDCLHEAGANPE